MLHRSQIKYQIFVSSTYEDLIIERQQAIKAILEIGHIPVGMEMFSAGDETQWQLIQRQIDDCDYYVVILGHRYGSMDGGVSYTEKEYNYAVEKGVPVLAFVIDDKTRWAKTKMDDDIQKITLLKSFKEKAKMRIIDHWKNSQDLKSKVAISLVKQFSINPRPGWVKSTEAVSADALNEISRLSNENAHLRKQIDEKETLKETKTLSDMERTIAILKTNTVNISFYFIDGTNWEEYKLLTYEQLFLQLVPELMVEQSTKSCASHIGIMLNPTKRTPRANWPTPSNRVRGIFADFHILNLIEHSQKKHEVSDANEYWTMSDYGKKVYAYLRKSLLEKGINTSEKGGDSPSSNDA